MLEMLKIKRTSAEIESRRAKITEQLFLKSSDINSPQLSSISTEDLRLLFELYDESFFRNWFRDHYIGKMKFSLSRKMTNSAGKTLCPKNISKIKPENLVVEIRIGVDFFLCYGQLGKSNTVCGIRTTNSLGALLLVFEHELCHVIEFLLFGKSSCKGVRFKTIAANMFGHSESYHKMPTNKQIASKVFGFRIGDAVSFRYKERRLTGRLYNVNKRAVVLVPDRNGMLADRQGKRYSKYYVPLTLLESAE
ncbi:MAG: hypothetical protein ABFD25_04515 [Clostridiaceae bacterium]